MVWKFLASWLLLTSLIARGSLRSSARTHAHLAKFQRPRAGGAVPFLALLLYSMGQPLFTQGAILNRTLKKVLFSLVEWPTTLLLQLFTLYLFLRIGFNSSALRQEVEASLAPLLRRRNDQVTLLWVTLLLLLKAALILLSQEGVFNG